MTITIVGPEVEPRLNWIDLTEALRAGHALPRAEVADTFLYRRQDTLLTRSAWIDGLGLAVKAAAVFPGNPAHGVPSINGAVNLMSDTDGTLEAIVDFQIVTKWKTAGDSLLSARLLARPDARRILIVGAGNVAHSMIDAYSSSFPGAEFTVWARNADSARAFAEATGANVASDLETAVRGAEVIATTTMSTVPLVKGEWLQPGTHLDLIGAYRPDMREADNETFRRARIFVDSRNTTLDHIGEVMFPINEGAMRREDIIADFYDLPSGAYARRSDEEITVAKNGGGAHLDLMTARYVLDVARRA